MVGFAEAGAFDRSGNAWFAWFQSTESKSRVNFLQLLRAGHTDYVLRGESLEYMAAQRLPKGCLVNRHRSSPLAE